MMVIRPIRAEDYAELYDIAVESGHGFTSLPVNDELLQRKISRSEASFAKKVEKPGDEGYLFVLEDPETGAVVGTIWSEFQFFVRKQWGKVIERHPITYDCRILSVDSFHSYQWVIFFAFARWPYRT